MLLLSMLTVSTSLAQTTSVKPIVLPDSTQAYIVIRPWMEFALRRIELAPLQEIAIENLRNELVAADDQLAQRDMYITNLEMDNARLGDIVDLSEVQLGISEESVVMVEKAYKRAKLWRNVTGLATIVIGIVAVLK